jgi:outer membrane protein assembly factor BamE (lipoprotein component of BamABCDE complex)
MEPSMRNPCLTVLACLVLAGCSTYERYGLKQGTSTEGEVRKAMGTPRLEFANGDGTRQLAYPKGPLGTETYMVFLGRDGVVDRIEQVLTDDSFQRIMPGRTSGDDVRRMIGPPWRSVRFDNLRQDAWDYRFRDSWGYMADFSVMIDDGGMVASKVVVRIEAGRDGQGMSR